MRPSGFLFFFGYFFSFHKEKKKVTKRFEIKEKFILKKRKIEIIKPKSKKTSSITTNRKYLIIEKVPSSIIIEKYNAKYNAGR